MSVQVSVIIPVYNTRPFLRAERVALVSGTFYFVRRQPGSFMSSFTESRFDEIWARRELHRILSGTKAYHRLRHRIDEQIASSIIRTLSAAYESRTFPNLTTLCRTLERYITRDESGRSPGTVASGSRTGCCSMDSWPHPRR